MGKKGKNKNVATENSPPKVESVAVEVKPEKKEEVVKVEVKPEQPPKVEAVVLKEEVKIPPPKEEIVAQNDEPDNDNETGTLKSKKKRNRNKKKNTLTTEDEEPKPEAVVENVAPKIEEKPIEGESQSNSETLKRKRKRNRKKNTNAGTTDETQEDLKEEKEEADTPENNADASETNTMKKRKRNRNKNKSANDAVNEALAAAQKVEPPVELPQPTERLENQARKGKKQKRFDLTSKKTINDEIQEKQDKEQKEARDHIQKEIAKREKLLSTIDMVLDCHKTEVEMAKNQQESLKDLTKLSTQQSPPKTPTEEKLVDKIEQVLGVTKLEIKNVQNQQAYVDRLETELAKVKQNKDILLGGASPSAIPPEIQKMTSQICDLSKETPKSKKELIKEIQNRDKLMSEINRVLDTTKTEIDKVQKQQKIIANLEVELNKIKEQEMAEQILSLEQEVIDEEEPPQVEKPPTASSSLLDALMANVGKLKEAQAMKDKQKAESEVKKSQKASSPPKSSESGEPKVDAKKPGSPKENKKGHKSEKKAKVEETPVVEKAPIVEQKPVENVPKEIVKEEAKPVVIAEPPKSEPIKEKPVVVAELPKSEPIKKEEKPVVVAELPKSEPFKEEAVIKAPVVEKPIEVQPIASSEPTVKPESPKAPEKKANDNKKNHKKDSPKGNNKNKNNGKKESPIPEKKEVIDSSAQKPSMADMLKNAPDPPPEEIIKKEEVKKEEVIPEEQKVEQAPLARPESAIIEAPIIPPPVVAPEKVEVIEKAPEKPIEVIAEVIAEKKEASPIDENMVIVSQSDVEQMIMELEKNELTDSKNEEAGDFASPVNDQKDSVKSPPTLTKNDGKQGKAQPAKTPSKPTPSKPAVKPKVDTNKKAPADNKKQPAKAAPPKPQKIVEDAPVQESSQASSESTPKVTTPAPSEIAPTPQAPKSPTKPDPPASKASVPKPVSSASPQRAQPKAGNVTKPASTSSPSRPTKSNTPSPSKSPSSVNKPIPANATTSPSTATPKITQVKPIPTRPAPQKAPSTSTKPPQSQTKQPPAKSNASKQTTPTAAKQQQQSTSDSVSRHRQMEPLNNISNVSQSPAFSLRKMDEKSTPLIPQLLSPNQMNDQFAILTADGSIKILLPPTSQPSILCNDRHRSKGVSRSFSKVSPVPSSSLIKTPKPINLMKNLFDDDDDDDDGTFLQYKLTPKNIFMPTICHVCKVNLSRYYMCKDCKMISYCKEEHMKIDYLSHKGFCMAIQLISKRRGGHIYNMSKHLSSMEFRNLRIHSILLCEEFLNRPLCAYERELLLFPRICHEQTCREWRNDLLSDCDKCGQVSFCTLHPHSEQHDMICNNFSLLQRIVLHEKSYGRINVELPQKVLKRVPILTENVLDTLRLLYRNIHAFKDECVNASLMQIATTPLTAFYGYQKSGMEFNEQMVIHLVGAEMQFEGDTLDKWEAFFLHLAHGVSDLQIVFIGPELNTENLPLEIISRTRMCKACRLNCSGIRFDFQCKKFYHDYCSSASYIKPDLICFFNPALHRAGFRGFETWPKTIKSAISSTAPVIVTSTTENENFLDLQRIQKVCDNAINVLVPPQKNPYASTRPERNFASDDDVSMMFKNNYMFVVSDRNLIDL